ncbi:hypothetical protein EXM22_01895 [Oceanispirochaeta crateris]|uniref:Uncharacterized protein n=1 Tax=Oceanispirochaeta crateris TaxID=2518645 RepID=A0A5C1QKX9_9SPIO|nr:hypothetical protein [Oceanispirochaeta crateris]QEN06802.1 hypothetical protein EXM22_01895 [Oceanispirochaeta crateris]
MTDETLHKILKNVKELSESDLLFSKPISDHVDVAKYWESKPIENDDIIANFNSIDLFLIKNEKKIFVGIVYDMFNDIHVFIKPEHRGKEYLDNALNKTIFPYLKTVKLRKKICISVEDDNEFGKKSAFRNGFVQIENDKYEKDISSISDYQKYSSKTSTDTTEIERLRKKAYFIYKLLYRFDDELKYRHDIDLGIKDIKEEVQNIYLDLKYNIVNQNP